MILTAEQSVHANTPLLGNKTMLSTRLRWAVPCEIAIPTPQGNRSQITLIDSSPISSIRMPMEDFEVLGRIGEGAHGVVVKAKNLQNGDIVALKKIYLKRLEEGISMQAFREIQALRHLHHENIISMREVFPHGSSLLFVFDFMVTDLSELIKDYEKPLNEKQIKAYVVQLLSGVAYMHETGIMHRDLKPANLLISSTGQLKIADFGLARLISTEKTRPLSHQVATRWYRAPELLYGAKFYGPGVDIWSVGCIFGEMLNCSPLFPGENDIEQLVCVFQQLGTPSPDDWPGLTELPDYGKITFADYPPRPMEDIVPEAPPKAVHLLSMLLVYDNQKRIEARQALTHDYVMSFPLAATLDELPKPKPKPIAKQQQANVVIDLDASVDELLVIPDIDESE